MLRTNLSTRPFYNERAIHGIALFVAVLVISVAAWQAVRIVQLSHYKTELNTAIEKHRSETALRERDAAKIRSGIDQKELARVAKQAKEANELIEQRTFSWTELFNLLEATLPDDVMLTAVRPDFKEGVTQINLELQSKSNEDIEAFWERLEKTGAFHDVTWSNVTVVGDLDNMQMRAVYTPKQGTTRPAAVKK